MRLKLMLYLYRYMFACCWFPFNVYGSKSYLSQSVCIGCVADAELVESNGTVVNNTAAFTSDEHGSGDLMSSADALLVALVGNVGDGCCTPAALALLPLLLLLLLLICEKNMRRRTAAFDVFFVDLAPALSVLLSLAMNGWGLAAVCGISGVEAMLSEDFVCGSGMSLNALLVVPRLQMPRNSGKMSNRNY